MCSNRHTGRGRCQTPVLYHQGADRGNTRRPEEEDIKEGLGVASLRGHGGGPALRTLLGASFEDTMEDHRIQWRQAVRNRLMAPGPLRAQASIDTCNRGRHPCPPQDMWRGCVKPRLMMKMTMTIWKIEGRRPMGGWVGD